MLPVGGSGVCYRYYCSQGSHPVLPSGMLSLVPLPLRVRPPPRQLVPMLPLPMVMMVSMEKKKEPTNSQHPLLLYFPGGRSHLCMLGWCPGGEEWAPVPSRQPLFHVYTRTYNHTLEGREEFPPKAQEGTGFTSPVPKVKFHKTTELPTSYAVSSGDARCHP